MATKSGKRTANSQLSEISDTRMAGLQLLGNQFNYKDEVVKRAKQVARKLRKSRSLTEDRLSEASKAKEESLEHNLLTKEEHTLSKSDVIDVLIN